MIVVQEYIGTDLAITGLIGCGLVGTLIVVCFIFLVSDWWTNAWTINCWTSDNIPNDKKEDFFYLKLGWQSAHTTFNLQNSDLYAKNWDWATLDSAECWRLNKVADGAQRSGALKPLGLEHTYKGRITYIGTKKGAKASPALIAVLRLHDCS